MQKWAKHNWLYLPVYQLIVDLQCKLPPETGPCRARILSYFFNSTSQRCEKFIYGGCQGNANRYSTADECAASCCPYKGMVHSDCACGVQTCRHPSIQCRGPCTAGCVCPHGTVLDEDKEECVPLDQCPSSKTCYTRQLQQVDIIPPLQLHVQWKVKCSSSVGHAQRPAWLLTWCVHYSVSLVVAVLQDNWLIQLLTVASIVINVPWIVQWVIGCCSDWWGVLVLWLTSRLSVNYWILYWLTAVATLCNNKYNNNDVI